MSPDERPEADDEATVGFGLRTLAEAEREHILEGIEGNRWADRWIAWRSLAAGLAAQYFGLQDAQTGY